VVADPVEGVGQQLPLLAVVAIQPARALLAPGVGVAQRGRQMGVFPAHVPLESVEQLLGSHAQRPRQLAVAGGQLVREACHVIQDSAQSEMVGEDVLPELAGLHRGALARASVQEASPAGRLGIARGMTGIEALRRSVWASRPFGAGAG
jgi:hypothetical protein